MLNANVKPNREANFAARNAKILWIKQTATVVTPIVALKRKSKKAKNYCCFQRLSEKFSQMSYTLD